MKQFLLKTLALSLLFVFAVSTSHAGTYASGLRVTNPDSVQAFDGNFADGSGALLWFTLNGNADSVKVFVLSNNVRIKAFDLMDSVVAGHHNVLWDGKKDDSVLVGMGNYSFEVWTSDTGNSTSTWVQAWQNPVYLLTGGGLSSRDIEVVKNPMSPDFGKLLLTESSASYGYSRMILASANGSLQTEYGRMLFPQGTSDFDPWFISVAKNGNQYVTNNSMQKIYVFKDTVLVNTIEDPAIPFPRGIVAMGSGDPTLLIATGRALVRRVPAGTVDTVYIDTAATAYLRDVAVDDSGYVYLSYGATSTSYTKVMKLSKTFAPLDTLTLPDLVTHVIVHSGVDPLSNADDSIYARARGANGGVFSLNFATKTFTKHFTPSTSTSASHSIATDMFGNIYYANPSAEWVRMYVPPLSAPMKWSTKGGQLNVLQASTVILDGFDNSEGRFNLAPTFSGSTAGIDVSSTADLTDSAKLGLLGGSQKIVLIDNAAVSTAWGVRHLSGGGSAGANVNIGANGYVGYWIMTSTAPSGSMVGIALDDPSDAAGQKRSIQLPVINDGKWHLYQWNIGDSTQWNLWVGGTKKAIQGPSVTIDAVWFYAPDDSLAQWTIYMDNVSHNANGKIGREPGRGDVTNNVSVTAFDASWILQHAVKMRPFSPEQVIAGDVNLSHNGTAVNALDAGIVLAHVVGKVPYLPWTTALPPLTNVNSNESVPLSLIIASVSGEAGKIVNIPVSVPNDLSGLLSAEMVIQYDASLLKVRSVTTSSLTSEFMIASNIEDGKVSIALANGTALVHGGQILSIEAEILQSSDGIALTVDNIQLNDRSIAKVTSVGDGQPEVPQTFALMQNYPNPFNPSTTIEFQLPASGFVDLKVYDVAGREVATLVSEMKNAGTHRIAWNAVDNQGVKVSSGVYFYRINAGQFNQIKKMVLLK